MYIFSCLLTYVFERTHKCTTIENTKLCLQCIVSIVCRPMYTDNKQMCTTIIIQTKISKPGFVDLVEVGCGRFFREGNTALCRASTPNWNSPLHIGVVSTEVSTRTRGPATLACKLQHSLLCSTARFGFTGCHCVLQLSERASEQETLNTLRIYTYMLA